MVINRIMCTSKILPDLCFTEQKIKTRIIFLKVICGILVVKMRWQNKKRLSINGAQSVKLEKGTIKFKNYFKQISVPFKIFVNFESNLEAVEIYEGSRTL